MNLHHRLRSLERAAAVGPRVCGTCGIAPGNGRVPADRIRLRTEPESAPPGPERCPECKTARLISIEFDRGNG